MKASYTINETASAQNYNLPFDYKKLLSIYILSGATKYIPKKCSNKEDWWNFNSTSQTSDIPEWFYINGRQISLFPIPKTTHVDTTNIHQIIVNYFKRVKSLTTADYTTGTITVTVGDETITGSGTTFTSAMAGRWLKINNNWYEINSFTSTTALELYVPYQGATEAGASYTIGELSVLPEDYQILPVYEAASEFWAIIGDNPNRAKFFDTKFKEGLQEMITLFSAETVNQNIEDTDLFTNLRNPNLYITQ